MEEHLALDILSEVEFPTSCIMVVSSTVQDLHFDFIVR